MRKLPLPSLPALILGIGVGALGIFIVYPIIFTLFGSFWSSRPGFPGHFTWNNYLSAFGQGGVAGLVVNTILFSLGSSVMGIAVGLLLSIVTVRTNTPFRRSLFYLPFFPLAFPVFIANLAWVYLFSQRVGLVNIALGDLGLSTSTFNIYSWPGMIWAGGMALVPISYITIAAALRNMDSSLEDASRMSGAGIGSTLRNVTVPLAIPAILSAFILDFTIAAGVFETPTMIGIPARISVFLSSIYYNVDSIVPPNYAIASADSSLILVIALILVFAYNRSLRSSRRYEVVSGKGYSSGVLPLGRWRFVSLAGILAYLVVGLFLPFVTMVMLSLVPVWLPYDLFGHMGLGNFQYVFSNTSGMVPTIVNSAISSVFAATIITFVSLSLVFVARRTKVRGRGLLEALGMLPIAIPALVIGFGLLWAFLTIGREIYGTLAVMVIALSLAFIPQGMRSLSGGVIQVQMELQEASSVFGAGMMATMRRIFLPILRPSLVVTWLYVFIAAFTSVAPVVLLSTAHTGLFAVFLWSLWSSGEIPQFAAGGMVLFAIVWSLILALVFVQRRLERTRVYRPEVRS